MSALLILVSAATPACDGPGDGSTGGPPAPTPDAVSDGAGADGVVAVDGLGDGTPTPDAVTDGSPGDGVLPPQDGVTIDAQPDLIPDPGQPDADPPQSPLVDPGCVDGQYSETMPTPGADIASLKATYSSTGDYKQWILDVLDARYPIGRYLTEGGLAADGFGGSDCVDSFLSSKTTADQVIGQLSTLVHECGHFYDLSLGFGGTFVITDTLTLSCSGGGPTRFGGSTFARSLLNTDAWSAQRPPCAGGFGFGCDSYAPIYLDGDPDDGQFDGGDQGFDSLFEETVQYVNSLATDYAFADHVSGGISARDGILTFLWYVMRYLNMARTQFPTAYQTISNSCWRDAILTVWGRAWLFLEATDGMNQLGIDDAVLLGLVQDETLLDEIELLRGAHGCN